MTHEVTIKQVDARHLRRASSLHRGGSLLAIPGTRASQRGMMQRFVGLTAVAMSLTLIVFATPTTTAVTRIARITRPKVRMFTINIFEDNDEYDDDTTTPRQKRRMRSNQGLIPNKLEGLRQAFNQVFQDNHHHHDHQRRNHGSKVHVGRMLSAVKEMEVHMRTVGMTQTANELKGNIEKAQTLYWAAPAEKRDSLPDLLQWEVETGIHGDRIGQGKLRVSNRSGAMGLFWIGHNVEYQNNLYRLMLEDGYTPLEAANKAFQQGLEPHMEWASKKIVKAAIPRMTPETQTKFFSMLSGYEEDRYGPQEHDCVRRDVQSILGVWEPMLDDWKASFDRLQLTDI